MLRLAAGLALLMGFCDVVTLIRFRVFAAMLTGNLLFVGERLGPPYDEAELDGVVYRLAVCLSHLLGAFFYCMLRDRCTARATLQILTPSLPALLLIGDLLSQHHRRHHRQQRPQPHQHHSLPPSLPLSFPPPSRTSLPPSLAVSRRPSG